MLFLENKYSLCTTKVTIFKMVRGEGEYMAEVERAIMEEERRVSEEAIRVSVEWQARAEEMRI